MMREQTCLRPTLFMLSGLIVWAAHFTLIYGFNAVACARFFAGTTIIGFGIVPLGIGVITLIALAALGGIVLGARAQRRPSLPGSADEETEGFMWRMSLAVTAISGLGIIWEALPALIVPPCA